MLLLEAMMVYSESHQEIRKLLRKLEKSRNELREKTAQLIQTEKMTALGELTAGVAHEINQPLNAIKIICQDIFRDIKKDRLDLGQLEGSLKEVIDEVMKMAGIVDHMRVFTRRTEGVHLEKIDIRRPIDGVFKLLGQQLKIHGIAITKELQGGLWVLGDPIRLEQVIMNLISNARDAVKSNEQDKGMKIGIRTYQGKSTRDTQASVVLEISDNGRGIPEQEKERIFEPFFTRKKSGEGTGLGLSVTEQIVKELGGCIEVESAEGQGTTFRVNLPACSPEDGTGEQRSDKDV
jgi:C4-dicarboxylate-specific signal transduction histidine kinase